MKNAGCAHPTPLADPAGRRLGFAVLIASAVAIVEGVGGQMAGSLALLADAGHMALDVLALLLAYVARRLGQRPPSPRAPWGLRRVEVMAALLNGLSLIGIAVVIAHEALERARAPETIDVTTMGLVAAAGFVANVASLRLLHAHQHDIGLRGAFLHLLGDAANSLAVVVGAACIWAFGHPFIDTAVSLVIAVVVALSSLPLMGHALAILLLLAPQPDEDRKLRERCLALVAGGGTADVRIWRLTAHEVVVSARLRLPPHAVDPLQVWRAARQAVLETYPNSDATIEVAPAS